MQAQVCDVSGLGLASVFVVWPNWVLAPRRCLLACCGGRRCTGGLSPERGCYG